MYIESPQNAHVRAWSQLKSKKGRLRQQSFLVEGLRLIEELLQSGCTVEALLWNVAADEPQQLLQEIAPLKVKLYELSPTAFAQVSDTTTSQGLIAVAKLPSPDERRQLPEHALLLDGLQDPGNVGTLLRSAEAFGFSAVCCGTNTVDPYAPKVVRATMGGLFRLRVSTDDSLVYIDTWRRAQPNGRVIMAEAAADEPCFQADLARPTLIVIGSEAFGPSAAVRRVVDHRVAIPMEMLTESLNAAVAGSILLYESFRQRR